MASTPAGQIRRRILNALQTLFSFRPSEAKHRTTSALDWCPQVMAMWPDHQTASTLNLDDLSPMIHIDDRVVHRAFETMAELTQPVDYLY